MVVELAQRESANSTRALIGREELWHGTDSLFVASEADELATELTSHPVRGHNGQGSLGLREADQSFQAGNHVG